MNGVKSCQTQSGHPLGNEEFMVRLGARAGHAPRPQAVGRPRKREEGKP